MTRTLRQRLGDEAEEQALKLLQAHGLALVRRNYRCRFGELDLVMRERGTVVIVEVRRRSRADFGSSLESVGTRKQQRLLRAARHLLARTPELARLACRFDVVGFDAHGEPQWLQDAFRADAW